jgi:hypothetical protein
MCETRAIVIGVTRLKNLLAMAASVACLMSMPAAFAQSADMTQFASACAGGADFLLGQLPEGTESEPILTPLCACLNQSFGTLPQKDIDILTADLKGEGTDEAHTAHGNYANLAETARVGLQTCFESPEVAAAIKASVPAEPATPATEPAPQ